MHRNWVTIPHVTSCEDADITELEAFRVALNKEQDVKVTLLAFLVKACVGACASRGETKQRLAAMIDTNAHSLHSRSASPHDDIV